jgi:hypothetical protein
VNRLIRVAYGPFQLGDLPPAACVEIPGKIVRDRRDGTYDVDYDDGEKETHVDRQHLRARVQEEQRKVVGDAGRDRLKEGAKVEADYRGKGKYYPGKITRDRRDGTFDIVTTGAYSFGTKFMMTVQVNPISNNPKSIISINGNLKTITGTYTSYPGNSGTWAYYTTNGGGSGNLYELITYNTSSPLSQSQYQQVEGYLAYKWGLNGSLPTSHPYYKISSPQI